MQSVWSVLPTDFHPVVEFAYDLCVFTNYQIILMVVLLVAYRVRSSQRMRSMLVNTIVRFVIVVSTFIIVSTYLTNLSHKRWKREVQPVFRHKSRQLVDDLSHVMDRYWSEEPHSARSNAMYLVEKCDMLHDYDEFEKNIFTIGNAVISMDARKVAGVVAGMTSCMSDIAVSVIKDKDMIMKLADVYAALAVTTTGKKIGLIPDGSDIQYVVRMIKPSDYKMKAFHDDLKRLKNSLRFLVVETARHIIENRVENITKAITIGIRTAGVATAFTLAPTSKTGRVLTRIGQDYVLPPLLAYLIGTCLPDRFINMIRSVVGDLVRREIDVDKIQSVLDNTRFQQVSAHQFQRLKKSPI